MPNKFNELLLKPDIIELYNEGITPNYGYLLNGRLEKDMVRTLYPLPTLNGNPITWEASGTEYLFPNVSLQPKQAGSGDPSPENVRPISGYDSVSVNVQGKNLWTTDISYPVAMDRLNYDEDTETYTLSPGKPAFSTSIFSLPFPIQTGTKVTCSIFFESGRINGTIAIGGYHKPNPKSWQCDVNFPKNQDLSGKMFTNTVVTTDTLTDFWVFFNSGCEVLEETKFKVMYSIGENSGNWEPYQPGTTATITLPETIYGGTADAVTGVGEVTRKVTVLDGEIIKLYVSGTGNNWITDSHKIPGIANAEASELICTIAPNSAMISNSIYQFVGFRSTWATQYFADVDEFNSFCKNQALAGTPVQLAYKLATPEPFQATGNQQLTSLLGYNTIYTDGDSIALSRKARRLEV